MVGRDSGPGREPAVPHIRHGVLGWFERQHGILSCIYYTIGILVFVSGFVTVLVNYLNRSDKTGITNPVEPPFGSFLPSSFYATILNYRYEIALVCVILLTIPALGFARRIRRRSQSIWLVDEIFRDCANIIAEIATFPDDGSLRALAAEVDRFLVKTVNRIAVLFSEYTGCPCHVTLKLLDPEQKGVRTIARDQQSVSNRGAIDEQLGPYPYSANSAFDAILTNQKVSYFFCNCLRLRAFRGKYSNANPDWRVYYRACAVVPITDCSSGATIREDSVWGFLTVDNRGGGFDGRCACALLQSIARMFYLILGEFAEVPVTSSQSTPPSAITREESRHAR